MIAYGILVTVHPDILDQNRGPAYAYLPMSILFTLGHYCEMIEQGHQYDIERSKPCCGKQSHETPTQAHAHAPS